jgi:hypothetical protein
MQWLLVLTILAAPLTLLVAPWRRLLPISVAVIIVQAAALWLSSCITSTLHCPSVCAFLDQSCEDLLDRNDAAPFGIALVGFIALALVLVMLIARLALRWAHTRFGARAQGRP